MKLGFLGKLFDSNEREIKKLEPLVVSINSLETKIKKLKDKDFAKADSIRDELSAMNISIMDTALGVVWEYR